MCSKKSTLRVARKVSSNRVAVPANNCPFGCPWPTERATHQPIWKRTEAPSPAAASLVPTQAPRALASDARTTPAVRVAIRTAASPIAVRNEGLGMRGTAPIVAATAAPPRPITAKNRRSRPAEGERPTPEGPRTSLVGTVEDCIGLNIGGPRGVR